MRTWRRRKETLDVFSYYAKRHKSAYISDNNNTNLKFFYVLSIYTRWDGLSEKTISRYCPFKTTPQGSVGGDVTHRRLYGDRICSNLISIKVLYYTFWGNMFFFFLSV